MASYEHHELMALLSILIKNGLTTKEEFNHELKEERRKEYLVMRGREYKRQEYVKKG